MWFVSHDRTRLVVFPAELEAALRRYCNGARLETGGVLVGSKRRDGGIDITRALPPPPDSVHRRHRFSRGTQGVLKAIRYLWRRGERYIGEWHLHPRGAPTASKTDTQTMWEFAHDSGLDCPSPVLLILGGEGTFSLYKYYNDRLHRLDLHHDPGD